MYIPILNTEILGECANQLEDLPTRQQSMINDKSTPTLNAGAYL